MGAVQGQRQQAVPDGRGHRGRPGAGYKCSCPSRKFPCKHALGLLLLWAGEGGGGAAGATAPDWAGEWLAGTPEARRGAADAAGRGARQRRAGRSGGRQRAAGRSGVPSAIDGGRHGAGAAPGDLLRGGLAGADRSGVRPVGRDGGPDGRRAGAGTRRPGAGVGGDRLVRSAAGRRGCWRSAPCCICWTRAASAASGCRLRWPRPSAPASASPRTRRSCWPARRMRDRWLVLAQYDTADGRLTTRRIWLYGTRLRAVRAAPRPTAPAGRAPELALPVGLVLRRGARLPPRRPAAARRPRSSSHGPRATPGPCRHGGTVAAALAATGPPCATTPGWTPGR